MKFEIDVELPEDVLKEWEPVAIRQAMSGDYVLSGIASDAPYVREFAGSPDCICLIFRRLFQWPAWLKCRYLTWDADGVVRGWNTFPSCLRHCWDADDDVVLIADGAAIDLPFPGGDWRTRIEDNPNWNE